MKPVLVEFVMMMEVCGPLGKSLLLGLLCLMEGLEEMIKDTFRSPFYKLGGHPQGGGAKFVRL